MTDRTRVTIPPRAPRSTWCWLCARSTPLGRTVDTDEGPQTICDECWDREYPTVPLDMTTVEGEARPDADSRT